MTEATVTPADNGGSAPLPASEVVVASDAVDALAPAESPAAASDPAGAPVPAPAAAAAETADLSAAAAQTAPAAPAAPQSPRWNAGELHVIRQTDIYDPRGYSEISVLVVDVDKDGRVSVIVLPPRTGYVDPAVLGEKI